MESNIKKQTEPQKAHEAILSDITIKRLLEIKIDIYKNVVPTYIMTPKGELKAIFSTKATAKLNEIERQINEIKQRILSFYNCL